MTASQQRLRTRIALALVVVVAGAVAGVVAITQRGGGSASAATSTQPEAWTLPRLDGPGEVSLAAYRGTPVVVNFFASWCTACQGELPGYADISRRLRGKVAFLGVDSLETGDGLALARRYGVDWWPLARDIDGQQASGLHDNLGGQGMPISAFYDAAGHLVYVSPGALAEDQVIGILRDRLHVGV